jgi:hypothetical protein
MKLRIKDNSIRLRLTRSEVSQLASHGQVQSHTELREGHHFNYRLAMAPAFGVDFSGNTLTVLVATEQAKLWCQDDAQIGIEHTKGALHLLIEKDFTCLSVRPEEQNGDYYPHPLDAR